MLSNIEIAEIIDETDLAYAILEGISPSRIKDADLADMWDEGRDLLIRIKEHIESSNDDYDDELDEDE